ncbi:hypothetical protein COC42_06380 [Sphingomonas spermidinifaciens]|uniref:Anti-sigma factor NepR domain-containing protein n=1 Tax=Sphingomonas spermidinifaciens TaxID=1141889 RepID=A0A2A4B7Q2_9SPHN|nr:hypothetical protein COC42_06380 [Sphingomonas spermidinifaciens]
MRRWRRAAKSVVQQRRTRRPDQGGVGLQGEIVGSDNHPPKPPKTPPAPANKNVGDALRAVYREAVEEAVPDDLLDLLKKLD